MLEIFEEAQSKISAILSKLVCEDEDEQIPFKEKLDVLFYLKFKKKVEDKYSKKP